MEAYIIHYTPLKDRKSHITSQLIREDIQPVFIEEFDRDVLTASDLQRFIKTGKLNLGSISLILKHIAAWKAISVREEPYGLIFEDDAILCPDFKGKLTHYLTQLPPEFDILMINGGCNLHIPKDMQMENKHVYMRGVDPTRWGGNGGTRCTDGYIISKKCAKKFVHIYESSPDNSISLPIDWWMNTLMRTCPTLVYWAEPSLVEQGTETGVFKQSY